MIRQKLEQLTELVNGYDFADVIAAYYQGFASVRSKGWFKDTHFYVRSVKALKDRV